MFRNKQKSTVSADDLFRAKTSIICLVQQESFPTLLQSVKSNSLPRKDPLKKLNLFINSEGILRVGGRLIRSRLL